MCGWWTERKRGRTYLPPENAAVRKERKEKEVGRKKEDGREGNRDRIRPSVSGGGGGSTVVKLI